MLERLSRLLSPHGLVVRGGMHPPDPGIESGIESGIGTLVLVGSLGGAAWEAFHHARRDEPDPLDAWTRRVVEPVAGQVGARALYPFEGPPWHPFQTWAMAAEGLKPSPIGILMHPRAGLWHAYRAALAFADTLPLPLPPKSPQAHPCGHCPDKPCLTACPVDAVSPGRYDVPACRTSVLGSDKAACRLLGCAARRACPVGAAYRYSDAELAFHMAAFLEAPWEDRGAPVTPAPGPS